MAPVVFTMQLNSAICFVLSWDSKNIPTPRSGVAWCPGRWHFLITKQPEDERSQKEIPFAVFRLAGGTISEMVERANQVINEGHYSKNPCLTLSRHVPTPRPPEKRDPFYFLFEETRPRRPQLWDDSDGGDVSTSTSLRPDERRTPKTRWSWDSGEMVPSLWRQNLAAHSLKSAHEKRASGHGYRRFCGCIGWWKSLESWNSWLKCLGVLGPNSTCCSSGPFQNYCFWGIWLLYMCHYVLGHSALCFGRDQVGPIICATHKPPGSVLQTACSLLFAKHRVCNSWQSRLALTRGRPIHKPYSCTPRPPKSSARFWWDYNEVCCAWHVNGGSPK